MPLVLSGGNLVEPNRITTIGLFLRRTLVL